MSSQVQTLQKAIFSDRQQDYAPEDEIVFNLGANEVSILSGKNSYFRCEFSCVPVGTGQFKGGLDYEGGGGFSLFDKVDIWSGDGATLIESLQEIPALMGTKNYYDKTEGLTNIRNTLEGLTGNEDGTVPAVPLSAYYSMGTGGLGEAQVQKVELCLPLRFSGVFYGKAFPVIACQGIQVRILLNSSMKALKADLVNGFIVQRDRTGRAPSLDDLPYDTNKDTSAFVIKGNVNQQLPLCWEIADDVGIALSTVADALVPAFTTTPTVTAAGAGIVFAGADVVSSSGSGVSLSLTALIAAPITGCTVTVVGEGYKVGDTLTILQATLSASAFGACTSDLVITLTAASFTTALVPITSIRVKTVGHTPAAGVYSVVADVRKNAEASLATMANLIGQHIYGCGDGGAIQDFGVITSVTDQTPTQEIELGFASMTPTSAFSIGHHCPVFGAILASTAATSGTQDMSYKLEDCQLICETVEPSQQHYNAMMAKQKSKSGLVFDIKSYDILRQNLFKNQLVSQSLLPTSEYRAKCVLHHQQYPQEDYAHSYWKPLNDNLRNFQYVIKGKNVPNRKIFCNREYTPDLNTWNALCDAERTKCLTAASVEVRRETHPAGRFVFGRELAKAGHSFNANLNEIRLTEEWGVTRNTGGGVSANVLPQFDKLLLTFVPHFRKLTMKPDNVVVAY